MRTFTRRTRTSRRLSRPLRSLGLLTTIILPCAAAFNFLPATANAASSGAPGPHRLKTGSLPVRENRLALRPQTFSSPPQSSGVRATTTATVDSPGPGADEIIERMDSLLRGKTNQGRSRMSIVTPNWRRTIEMDSWAQGDDYAFIHILSPARERDTTFLKRKKLLYQYIPSAEMRIKISPSMMMQSWMGSDFTNDDLVKESHVVKDYHHKLIGTERVHDRDCYKIELTPKPDAAVVWGGITVWVDKKTYLPVKEVFFDEKGCKVRRMEFSDYRPAGDRLYPYRIRLVPLDKEGHSTVLQTVKIIFNKRIPRRVFTLKNLEKPR